MARNNKEKKVNTTICLSKENLKKAKEDANKLGLSLSSYLGILIKKGI